MDKRWLALGDGSGNVHLAFSPDGQRLFIRHGHSGRAEKDVDDVIELVRINRVNVAEPEWRELFVKSGDRPRQ
jgi:hypothetical protein